MSCAIAIDNQGGETAPVLCFCLCPRLLAAQITYSTLTTSLAQLLRINSTRSWQELLGAKDRLRKGTTCRARYATVAGRLLLFNSCVSICCRCVQPLLSLAAFADCMT